MYRLVRIRGPQKRESWALQTIRAYVLGRSAPGEPSPDIDLFPDERISETHARIWFADGGWRLRMMSDHPANERDETSAAGVSIQPWQEFQIGDTRLMLAPPNWHRLRSGSVIFDLEVAPSINLALTRCAFPVISRCTLRNTGIEETGNLEMQVLLPEFGHSDVIPVPPVPANGEVKIAPPSFHFDGDALERRVERKLSSLRVRYGDKMLDGSVTLWLLASNEWAGQETYREQLSLAAFVMPNHPVSAHLTGEAGLELPADHSAEDALQALYEHLRTEWKISYKLEPPGWESRGQRIRFPDRILSDFSRGHGQGTCIDLALLIAACLEHLQHQPLIALLDLGECRHALVGCWKETRDGLEPVLYEKQALADGAVWVDPNGCTFSPEYQCRFPQARDRAEELLAKSRLLFALDLKAARTVGRVEPLPFTGIPQASPEVRQALHRAERIGDDLGQPVGTVQLLVGLFGIEKGVTRDAFKKKGIDPEAATLRLMSGLNEVAGSARGRSKPSRHYFRVLDVASSLAARDESHVILDYHAFKALLLTASRALDNALASVQTDRETLQQALRDVYEAARTSTQSITAFPEPLQEPEEKNAGKGPPQ